MGFNIGRFLGSIAGPVIGLATGNPALGLAISGASAAGFADAPAAAATIGRATQSGPVSAPAPSQQFGGFPFAPTSIAPSVRTAGLGGAIIRQIPGAVTGIAAGEFLNRNGGSTNPISQILARARQATGGPVTRNKIIDAAKTCGLETAAQTFGLDVRQVCLVVVKGRTRRRRGVSAADIRRTKRTIGFASKIRKDLKALAR